MPSLCYILLCHKNPGAVIDQVRMLTRGGDSVVVHLDLNAPKTMMPALQNEFSGNNAVHFAKRVNCGWAEWSLVDATLGALRLAEQVVPEASHFYLISGDCWPVKSAQTIRDHLATDNRDIIEVKDFFDSGWIKVGLKAERLIYRHYFNERTQKRLFYGSMALQKALKLERVIPDGLQVMIGSQWWCLRRGTVEKILAYLKTHRNAVRFFRTTWVPDETFFQTLVHHLVPKDEIASHPPTFLLFSDYGMPVNFHDDHFDFLVAQDRFFARKLSTHAVGLKVRLAELYAAEGGEMPWNGRGREFFSYVSNRGRTGQRYAGRFWERGSEIGRGRTIIVIACKKWHVAKRFARALGDVGGIRAYGYVFNEIEADLPDMGNVDSTLAKRTENHRAFLNLLFEVGGTDRITICLDPASIRALDDLGADAANIHLVEIACAFSDNYLMGHAARMGLSVESLSEAMQADLLTTLRANIREESDALAARDFAMSERMEEHGNLEEITGVIKRLTGFDDDAALRAAHQGRYEQMGSGHVQI